MGQRLTRLNAGSVYDSQHLHQFGTVLSQNKDPRVTNLIGRKESDVEYNVFSRILGRQTELFSSLAEVNFRKVGDSDDNALFPALLFAHVADVA